MSDEQKKARAAFMRKWHAEHPDQKIRGLPRAEYNRQQRLKDGLAAERRRKRAWRTANPEKNSAARHRWRACGLRRHKQTYAGRIAALWLDARKRCRHDGLSMDEVVRTALLANPVTTCPCCGIELDYSLGSGHNRDDGPSLDRFDNAKGYIAGNVFVICRRCNVRKRDASIKDLENLLAYMETRVR